MHYRLWIYRDSTLPGSIFDFLVYFFSVEQVELSRAGTLVETQMLPQGSCKIYFMKIRSHTSLPSRDWSSINSWMVAELPVGHRQALGSPRRRARTHHSFRGSFSAGSAPIFASKYAFFSIILFKIYSVFFTFSGHPWRATRGPSPGARGPPRTRLL